MKHWSPTKIGYYSTIFKGDMFQIILVLRVFFVFGTSHLGWSPGFSFQPRKTIFCKNKQKPKQTIKPLPLCFPVLQKVWFRLSVPFLDCILFFAFRLIFLWKILLPLLVFSYVHSIFYYFQKIVVEWGLAERLSILAAG